MIRFFAWIIVLAVSLTEVSAAEISMRCAPQVGGTFNPDSQLPFQSSGNGFSPFIISFDDVRRDRAIVVLDRDNEQNIPFILDAIWQNTDQLYFHFGETQMNSSQGIIIHKMGWATRYVVVETGESWIARYKCVDLK